MVEMKLILNDSERELLKLSLMDTIVNSQNFNSFEKKRLESIYQNIKAKEINMGLK